MKKLISLVLCCCLLLGLTPAFAEALLPEEGNQTKKNGNLIIDYSHMDQGYVLVKTAKSKKKVKVQVKAGDTTLMYDLNGNGDYEVFPLQYGNGKYTYTLYKQDTGKRYTSDGKITLTVKMTDELSAFLYPNQYVNYDSETAAVAVADELCKGLTTQAEIWDTIKSYMKKNFMYDYTKASSVEAGTLPQIDEAWLKHMGICQDLSAITVAMLRSQGVPARLMVGTLRGGDHAWVSANVDGKEKLWDPTASLQGVKYSAKEYELQRQY